MDFETEKIRDFEEDLKNSNSPIIRSSWEKVIRIKFGEDCTISWKDDTQLQKGLGTDITVKTKKGRRYSIELKTRSYNCLGNPEYIMEIVSHIYSRQEKPRDYLRSKEGWIYSTTAEYIFHGTLNKEGTEIIEVIFYNLSSFKSDNYKSNFNYYKNFWLPTSFKNGEFQLTLNKLIPKDVIQKDSLEFWEWRQDGTQD